MPHFSETGHDEVLCQLCHRVVDTGIEKVEWRPDLTGTECAGNVCQDCLKLRRCPCCGGPGDGSPCERCSDEDGARPGKISKIETLNFQGATIRLLPMGRSVQVWGVLNGEPFAATRQGSLGIWACPLRTKLSKALLHFFDAECERAFADFSLVSDAEEK